MASISIALGLSFSPEHDLTIWTSFEGYQDTYDSGVEGKDSGVLKIWSEMIRINMTHPRHLEVCDPGAVVKGHQPKKTASLGTNENPIGGIL